MSKQLKLSAILSVIAMALFALLAPTLAKTPSAQISVYRAPHVAIG